MSPARDRPPQDGADVPRDLPPDHSGGFRGSGGHVVPLFCTGPLPLHRLWGWEMGLGSYPSWGAPLACSCCVPHVVSCVPPPRHAQGHGGEPGLNTGVVPGAGLRSGCAALAAAARGSQGRGAGTIKRCFVCEPPQSLGWGWGGAASGLGGGGGERKVRQHVGVPQPQMHCGVEPPGLSLGSWGALQPHSPPPPKPQPGLGEWGGALQCWGAQPGCGSPCGLSPPSQANYC